MLSHHKIQRVRSRAERQTKNLNVVGMTEARADPTSYLGKTRIGGGPVCPMTDRPESKRCRRPKTAAVTPSCRRSTPFFFAPRARVQ